MRDSTLLQEVNRCLSYDRETGIFTWKVTRGRQKAGTVAGTTYMHPKSKVWYVKIKVAGKQRSAHRLAWLVLNGKLPKFPLEIDHRDGDGRHNWETNLRAATRGQNSQNHRMQKRNTSGCKGVRWYEDKQHYRAYIRANGRQVHLGVFRKDDLEGAIAARKAAEKLHHGEYARS